MLRLYKQAIIRLYNIFIKKLKSEISTYYKLRSPPWRGGGGGGAVGSGMH
jgi:hypothetical protein